MGSMTPEELIELCDAADYRRACKHVIQRQGCADCDEYRRRDAVGARYKLGDFGFSDTARARSYAALMAALDRILEEHGALCVYPMMPAFDQAREALATTEEKS